MRPRLEVPMRWRMGFDMLSQKEINPFYQQLPVKLSLPIVIEQASRSARDAQQHPAAGSPGRPGGSAQGKRAVPRARAVRTARAVPRARAVPTARAAPRAREIPWARTWAGRAAATAVGLIASDSFLPTAALVPQYVADNVWRLKRHGCIRGIHVSRIVYDRRIALYQIPLLPKKESCGSV